MRHRFKPLGLVLIVGAAAAPAIAQSDIDPTNKRSWQENCGWMNWRDANGGAQGVRDQMTFLSGFIWCENIGWINVGDGTPGGGASYTNASGKRIKVEPLTDEDRFTIVRWIDLGCPIDLDYDSAHPDVRHFGWMLDDNRPTLTLTAPHAGANASLNRIVIGAYDYYTGLDMESLTVTADFPVNDTKPGENLAAKFKPLSQGVWELKLAQAINELPQANINVSVKDKQGNVSRIERTFAVGTPKLSAANR